MEEVVPEIVFSDDEGYKSIDYSKLTPILIEALKELKKEVDVLKAQISGLSLDKDNSTAQVKGKQK